MTQWVESASIPVTLSQNYQLGSFFLVTWKRKGIRTPSISGAASIAAPIGIHCDALKSVPDPFPKRQAAPLKFDADADARCVHSLNEKSSLCQHFCRFNLRNMRQFFTNPKC